MTISHRFGGKWTEEKLEALGRYLSEYTKIFKRGERTSWYKIIYFDAFAGTGYRSKSVKNNATVNPLFNDSDAISFQKGSAIVALETEPSFDEYVFVELSGEYANELQYLHNKFSNNRKR